MKSRLFVAMLSILILPLFAGVTTSQNGANPVNSSVAFAGHLASGGWCECCSPGCICDPGEDPNCQSANPISDLDPEKGRDRKRQPDYSAGGMLIIAVLLFGLRFAFSRA